MFSDRNTNSVLPELDNDRIYLQLGLYKKRVALTLRTWTADEFEELLGQGLRRGMQRAFPLGWENIPSSRPFAHTPSRRVLCSAAHPMYWRWCCPLCSNMTDQWAETLKEIEESTERLRDLIAEAQALSEQLESERTRRATLPYAFAVRVEKAEQDRLVANFVA